GLEGGVYDIELEEREKKKHQAVLEDGVRRLAEIGTSAKGEVVVGEAIDEITRYARKIDANLIVVGHKHLDSWAARWWRGSLSKSLIEHAPCSLLVVITK
ncbi:MAG TPA: universal stress protein, partial [Usitatibacter sp.]|nr:universal stress protein [Usitatibacter sp.]